MLTYTVYQLRNGTTRIAELSDPVVSWLLGRKLVNDFTTDDEPSEPAVGDTYLIPAAATGSSWAGNDGKLVTWTPSGIWEGIVAPAGLLLTNAAGEVYAVGVGPLT